MTEAAPAIPQAEPQTYAYLEENRRRSGFWTDERLAILKDGWAKGRYASVIAKQVGGGCTRSAVLGKVYRLNLNKRKKGAVSTALSGKATEKRIGRRAIVERRRKLKQKVTVAVHECNYGSSMSRAEYREIEVRDNATINDLEIPAAQRRTISQLESHHCRWPVGNPDEPDFFFCGATAVEGSSYCPDHYCMAYKPVGPVNLRVKDRAGEGNMKLLTEAA